MSNPEHLFHDASGRPYRVGERLVWATKAKFPDTGFVVTPQVALTIWAFEDKKLVCGFGATPEDGEASRMIWRLTAAETSTRTLYASIAIRLGCLGLGHVRDPDEALHQALDLLDTRTPVRM